ncbi:MAG TPA: hypothetical protein VFI42_00845 [Thermomicrobiaceae bacterium]|nr:hypothetical protein [Thermomicrobiaceae bacterium]
MLLLIVWWPLAWLGLTPVSNYSFFPLWLGLVLTLDGLNEWRSGTSLWRRGKRRFVLLFVISAPFWWIFEWVDRYLHDWHYMMPLHRSLLVYAIMATFDFSTVIPAVLEMSELLASFRVGRLLPRIPAWRVSAAGVVALEACGWFMLLLVILLPRYFFPLTWIALFLIVEPFNLALRQRSVGWFLARGESAALWNLMLGALATGWFWEMWNYYSMPKWYYTVPYVDFWHVWEMPLLGYGGYLPFGLEIMSVFALGFWLIERQPQHYTRLVNRQVEAAAEPVGERRQAKTRLRQRSTESLSDR